MKVRQCVEFIVFPKFFNALWFYAKGNYSLSFTLSIQDPYGNIKTAYPILHQGKQANQLENKKAYTSIQNGTGEYSTQNFYITYNQQSTILHTACVFKVEMEKDAKYKTYLDAKLILTKFRPSRGSEKGARNNQGKENQINKKVTTVDQRRLYINRHSEINKFKRLVFTECQYFSFVDLYIASTSLGYLVRAHDYQLIDFFTLPIQQKSRFNYETLEISQLSDQQKGQLIFNAFFKSETNGQDLSRDTANSLVKLFYQQRIGKLIDEYERLVSIYNGIITKMLFISSSSQILQKIKIPVLLMLKKEQLSLQKLLKYYECKQGKARPKLQDHLNKIVYLKIMQEATQYRKNVIYLWQNILLLLLKLSVPVFQTLLIQEITYTDDFVKKNAIVKDIQIDQVSVIRQRLDFIQRRKRVIQSLIIYEQQDTYHPMLMIEGYEESKAPRRSIINQEIDSLTVFIHGYQGSDYDLQKARNFMNIYNPNSHGLLIKSIQDQQQMNIQQLGKTLANQIKLHIISSSNNYKKINFIGYSMGGVLARQSLKHLEQYKNKMNLFISFASPHLGIRNSENSLVNTGVWYLVNVSKVKTMRQLHCEQTQNQIPTLKKLSDCEGLSWFSKVVVASSKQDNFVPYYSSRLSENQQEQIVDMCIKIKSKIKKLERVQVWFDVEHDIKTWDKIIGRRAHIQFLENTGFLDSFFKIYGAQL